MEYGLQSDRQHSTVIAKLIVGDWTIGDSVSLKWFFELRSMRSSRFIEPTTATLLPHLLKSFHTNWSMVQSGYFIDGSGERSTKSSVLFTTSCLLNAFGGVRIARAMIFWLLCHFSSSSQLQTFFTDVWNIFPHWRLNTEWPKRANIFLTGPWFDIGIDTVVSAFLNFGMGSRKKRQRRLQWWNKYQW